MGCVTSIRMGRCLAVLILCISSVAIVFGAVSDNFTNFMDEEEQGLCNDCQRGTTCLSCGVMLRKSHCARSAATDPFKIVGTSLPFNKYSFLTTHNSFAINGESSHTGSRRYTLTNQDENVTEQLKKGVRALMLDTYDFRGDVWLCHSRNGKCHNFTAFVPARKTFAEIEDFLSTNSSEIVTLILEDYVTSPNGLTNVFKATGLMKYWFPVSKMPRQGGDWPLVKDMISANERLVVFTSLESKEQSERIAYQWNYMVENQFGDGGMNYGNCPKRAKESAPLNDKTKTLVLINHFPTIPVKRTSCKHNSKELMDMLGTCYVEAGDRWANFIAVDYFERSDGGGAFQALDMVNGKLLCGREDIHQCPFHRAAVRLEQFVLLVGLELKRHGVRGLRPLTHLREWVHIYQYEFLTRHNSFSINGERMRSGIPRFTFINQDESVAEQLNRSKGGGVSSRLWIW